MFGNRLAIPSVGQADISSGLWRISVRDTARLSCETLQPDVRDPVQFWSFLFYSFSSSFISIAFDYNFLLVDSYRHSMFLNKLYDNFLENPHFAVTH